MTPKENGLRLFAKMQRRVFFVFAMTAVLRTATWFLLAFGVLALAVNFKAEGLSLDLLWLSLPVGAHVCALIWLRRTEDWWVTHEAEIRADREKFLKEFP